MQNQLHSLYESEGYRVESMKADGDRAQVTMRWDRRFLPRCARCGNTARINRTTVQSALDLPLGPASFVGLVYEAVQGHCAACGRYETVRPPGIVGQHKATLRLMRQVSLLCRWMPVQSVCEVVPVTPSTAYRYDGYILRTELPAPRLDGLEALLVDEKHLGKAGFVTLVLNARTGELLWLGEGRGKAALEAHLPDADIVFDKFHLVANLGEVITKIRRRTQREADAEGRSFVKGQRYNLLRNPENLSEDGRARLDMLLAANRDLSVVYTLKDAFKQIWGYTYRKCAQKRLIGWIAMAMESGIAELQRFARGLAEAQEQILNFCRHRITSARIEAFNTVVSRVMHKACGVANLDFLFLKLRQESLQR